jgi:hypothetical protein
MPTSGSCSKAGSRPTPRHRLYCPAKAVFRNDRVRRPFPCLSAVHRSYGPPRRFKPHSGCWPGGQEDATGFIGWRRDGERSVIGWRNRCLPATATGPPPPEYRRRHAGCGCPLLLTWPSTAMLTRASCPCARPLRPRTIIGGTTRPGRERKAASTRRFVLIPPPVPGGDAGRKREKGIAMGEPLALRAEDRRKSRKP